MSERTRNTQHATRQNLLLSFGLFLLALLPRLPDLGRFLTPDEFLWVDRSRNFLAGLTNPAYLCTTVVEKWEFAQGLACTLRTGHPGVTTMWTGSLGFVLRWLADGRPAALHDYVAAVSTNPLDAGFIAPERLGTVLITSLWVVAVYWLARRLFDPAVAWVGALLIALDPFHIALSRVIHHDALSTTFMTLSVLAAFIYWGERGRPPATGGRYFYERRWLLASGLLAGFGFLSKSPALYLMPFIALTGLWFYVEGGKFIPHPSSLIPHPSSFILLIVDGLLWFAVSVAVVFIFWPALWVIPREALETVFFIGSKYATGGHAKGNFFLGEISQDPGAWFYPVTWLFRATPLAVIGVVAALVAWLGQMKDKRAGNTSAFSPQPSSFLRYLPLILLFIAGYYLLMTLGEKKQDRYFLPAYPWLNLIAAFGLRSIFNFQKRSPLPAPRFTALLSLLVLLLNGYLVYTTFPYYFTYFNPLLGGAKAAERAITIGWGEGLDLAADYLNHKPDPAHSRVASWYESTFAPFYHGPSISYSKEKGKALAGDYVIFYINQTQRRFPDDIFFEYFERRFKPDKIITLHGLNYAWIYPSLGVDHYIQDQTYTGIASLLAWQWLQGDRPLIPGQPAEFELYWEYLGKQPDEPFFFRLVDAQDRAWAEGESRPLAAGNPPPAGWREGEIIVERGTLTPPAGLPPGQYRLQIGFYTQAAAVQGGELLFAVPDEEALIPVAHAGPAAPFPLPPAATSLAQPLGDSLTLLGAAWPTGPLPPQAGLPLDLYWRVEQPLSAGSEVHLGLMDPGGQARQAWFNLTLAETFDAADTTWQPGDIVHTRWQLDLLPEVAPGDYHFELVWPEDASLTLPFGRIIVADR
ncbi:MAG: glycosyltransferase family 39 protein [Chloroflexota bacterium]